MWGVSARRLGRPIAAGLVLLEVGAQAGKDFLAFPFRQLSHNLIEGEMHDVVVVEFLRRQVLAELQPELADQLDFVGREMRRGRAQIAAARQKEINVSMAVVATRTRGMALARGGPGVCSVGCVSMGSLRDADGKLCSHF